jgi:hypothetical protein
MSEKSMKIKSFQRVGGGCEPTGAILRMVS